MNPETTNTEVPEQKIIKSSPSHLLVLFLAILVVAVLSALGTYYYLLPQLKSSNLELKPSYKQATDQSNSNTDNINKSGTDDSIIKETNHNNELAFMRNKQIWVSNSDGSKPTQISKNSEYDCAFYAQYISSSYQTLPNFSNFSPWSKDGNNLAYYCFADSSHTTPILHIYDMQTGMTTDQKDNVKYTYPSNCQGCGGGPIVKLDLLDKTKWFMPPDWDNTFNKIEIKVNAGYYTGNNIWIISIPNYPYNPNVDAYQLYDVNNKRVIYKWNNSTSTYAKSSQTYAFFEGVNIEPECILDPSGTKEACIYSLSLYDANHDNQDNPRIRLISIIDINSGKIITKVGNYGDPYWNDDGSSIYVTKDNTISILDKALTTEKVILDNAVDPIPNLPFK